MLLDDLRRTVCDAAAGFDAGSLDASGAASAVSAWTAITNAAQAACALAAARAAACGTADAPQWLASQTGTSAARAKEMIATGQRMRSETRERATGGALSLDQAAAISDAAALAPEAEEGLLATAAHASLGELRDACAHVKAAADPDPESTYRRIHTNRRLRRWRDREGAEHLHATGTSVDMAKIDQAIKPVLDEIFTARRRRGVREPLEAYTFDALVAVAERRPSGAPHRERYLSVLRVDLSALVRGGVELGESCEIAGLGPIPAATARELLGESILKLVITNGVEVANVTHLGRGPSTAQKIALLWQQPLCSREGCGRRARLEIDHRDPWADVHRTELHNLDPLCHPDHDLKTLEGWALVEGTGSRPMVPPTDPRHPKNRPRARLAS